MEKDKIGFDLDSVICDTEIQILNRLKERHNLYLTLEDLSTYEFETNPKLGKYEIRDLDDVLHNGVLYRKSKPFEGAVEALKSMQKKYEIHIITSRARTPAKITYDWLEKYKVPCDDLHIVAKEKKWEIIRWLEIKAFVEDNFYIINTILRNCMLLPYGLIVMDRPWNRNYYHKDVTRVYTLDEACDLIRTQKRTLKMKGEL